MDARLDCLFEMRAQMWRKALNARVAATVAAHALVDARKAKAPAQELETLEAASSRANAAEVAAEEALRRAEEALQRAWQVIRAGETAAWAAHTLVKARKANMFMAQELEKLEAISSRAEEVLRRAEEALRRAEEAL